MIKCKLLESECYSWLECRICVRRNKLVKITLMKIIIYNQEVFKHCWKVWYWKYILILWSVCLGHFVSIHTYSRQLCKTTSKLDYYDIFSHQKNCPPHADFIDWTFCTFSRLLWFTAIISFSLLKSFEWPSPDNKSNLHIVHA